MTHEIEPTRQIVRRIM